MYRKLTTSTQQKPCENLIPQASIVRQNTPVTPSVTWEVFPKGTPSSVATQAPMLDVVPLPHCTALSSPTAGGSDSDGETATISVALADTTRDALPPTKTRLRYGLAPLKPVPARVMRIPPYLLPSAGATDVTATLYATVTEGLVT